MTTPMKKTVTVFAATGVAGSACVEELLRQDVFKVQVLARKSGQQEKSSSGAVRGSDDKQRQWDDWQQRGVVVRTADVTDHSELIPALEGTDYLLIDEGSILAVKA